MSDSEGYRSAASRLVEWGRKRAEVESADRDQMIWDAFREGMPKAEIARLTGLHWATVDRTVRDMKAKHGDESED